MILLREINSSYLNKNCVCLQDNETGRDVYVSIGTYNQCIRLAKEYEDNPETYLSGAWGGLTLSPDENEIDKFLDRTAHVLPYPINMLMPYINMLIESNPKIMDKFINNAEEEDLTDLYGYLHVLSQMIDFEKYTMFESKFRNEVKLSDFMYNNYEASWREYDIVVTPVIVSSSVSSMASQVAAPVTSNEVVEDTNDEEDEDAELHALWASILNEPDEPMPVSEVKPIEDEPAKEPKQSQEPVEESPYKPAGYPKELLDDMDF